LYEEALAWPQTAAGALLGATQQEATATSRQAVRQASAKTEFGLVVCYDAKPLKTSYITVQVGLSAFR
jgi:archaellin